MLAAAAATAAASSTAPPISVTYSKVVDFHISELMPVFLSDELNPEWSPTLESHVTVYDPKEGALAHQTYRLPWPMAPRDVLLKCERHKNDRDAVLTSECRSVESTAAPVRDSVVRMELSHTAWRIEALGERTRLTLSLEMPASVTAGVPKYVVRYCQRTSLKDSVEQLIAAVERLGLPPHESFARWRRSRAAAAAALQRAPPVGVASASTLVAWVAASASASTLAALLGALVFLLLAHVLTFACLARMWRRKVVYSHGSSVHEWQRQRAASPTSVLGDELGDGWGEQRKDGVAQRDRESDGRRCPAWRE